jgi:hypothetical protein
MVVVQTDSTGRMIQDVIMREMGTERARKQRPLPPGSAKMGLADALGIKPARES